MKFEWDEPKNQANINKHGISFERAITIFAGTIISAPDIRYDYGESREVTIGMMDDCVIIVVVHTDRQGVIRIISARPANRKEREKYYGYIQR